MFSFPLTAPATVSPPPPMLLKNVLRIGRFALGAATSSAVSVLRNPRATEFMTAPVGVP